MPFQWLIARFVLCVLIGSCASKSSKHLEVALGLLARHSGSPSLARPLHCFLQRVGEFEALVGVGKYNSSLAVVIER